MRLYVGNLNYNTSEDELREIFGEYGEVVSVALIRDRETGRAKGFGFVEFADEESGRTAITALDGKQIGGRAIKVNEARPREEGASRGGSQGGGYGRY